MNIKPTKLITRNIGKLAGENVINIDKPMILLYGEIRQGKSTFLKSVRWVFGGEFPQDIITHGQKEGSIELHFDGGMIGRSFYRAKDETTKARPVVFVRNGKPISSPVTEIKRFLNPFLLDQDFLRNKTELERKQYFTELFDVDTTELDTELSNSQRAAQQLRATITGYGEIDLTPVDPVDITAAQTDLQNVRQQHASELTRITSKNREILEHNADVFGHEESAATIAASIGEIEWKLTELKTRQAIVKQWLLKNSKKSEIALPIAPDTRQLEQRISDAGATNVRAENYQAAKKRTDEKKSDEQRLLDMEKRQREIKSAKQAKLKSIGESCGIKGLEFDEAGNFIYQGTTAGMISDSQIMRLSSELSALYPEGFGLDLIDRAESLGKSIFEFVERAKAEKKTIMATIVGERPAKVPPEIGVFVVDDGKAVQSE